MKFYCRPFIDVDVRRRDEAVQFYRDVLGFEMNSETYDKNAERIDLTNGLVTLGFRESPDGHATFEFRVDNIAAARKTLAEKGCEFLEAETPNRVLVKDPFGNHFQLVQL